MTATMAPATVAGSLATVAGQPRVCGLDLSLSCTGVASSAGWTATVKAPAKLRGHARMAHLRRAILDHTTGADLVVVEGPSYGNQGTGRQSGHHERAGLWWIVTHALWAADVPTAVVAPATRARYATGRGNAGKADVMRETARRFPWFQGAEDECDALILAALGADHLGHPMAVMPAAHRAALDAVEWPDVAVTS